MGLFAAPQRTRKSTVTVREESQEMPERLRTKVPARFAAVGEALVAGSRAHAACAVVGRELARDGVDLGEALEGLRSTFAQVLGQEPDFGSTQAMSVAWSDETLGYLHQVSCEDPLTGLATLAHLRARLTELQRAAELSGTPASEGHALVVVDLSGGATGPGSVGGGAQISRALLLARVADRTRLVFAGEESIGEATPSRLLVLAPRTDDLGLRVVVLRDLISDSAPLGGAVRVWIEGLPSSHAAMAALLDELART
ncbi:MAG TPA: hypothetical protein VHO29_19525 [Marmoricola sp.]|nr:hypothetical protein [Marmoricola sp.]